MDIPEVEDVTNEPGSASAPAASSSGLPRDAADVNVYEPKKPRLDGQDDLMHDQHSYDLNLRWLEDLHLHQGDQHALLMASSDTMTIEMDLDVSELSHCQQKNIQRDASAYLVKKMRDSKVVYSRLTNDLKELFNRAKTKEVSSFIKAAAVHKALNSEEVREAFGQGRIMRARWVLTWKPTPPEDIKEAKEEAVANVKSTYTKDGLRKAKARVVLLGYEHPDLLRPEFKTASPAQSSLGRNLLYMMACTHNWALEGLDLATAFLQTQPTEADQNLWTRGVSELREALGLGPNDIMKILKTSTAAPQHLAGSG